MSIPCPHGCDSRRTAASPTYDCCLTVLHGHHVLDCGMFWTTSLTKPHSILSRPNMARGMYGCTADSKPCEHVRHSCCPAAQDEASALLSALATALSNCRLTWPAFLPVHDPLRDACWGIAISGLGTIHYDSDSTHSSSMWSPELLQV